MQRTARSREVGIRKVVGARKKQVIVQFITESIAISLLSLVFSFLLFLFLREHFLGLHTYISNLASMEISFAIICGFIFLALMIGLIAGIFPAIFFAKIRVTQVLKGVSSLQLFKHLNLRKSLIVVQYVFSLIFITSTVIG